MNELREVLWREKFLRLRSDAEASQFVSAMFDRCQAVNIVRTISECRDPKDDKFLELALNGEADVIISGDIHLLEMHPWRGIAILKPAHYLARQSGEELP
jgi:putative PIN family toxin of toxin-antitoxin system